MISIEITEWAAKLVCVSLSKAQAALRKALASPDRPCPRAAELCALHPQRGSSSESQRLQRNRREHEEQEVNHSTGFYFPVLFR